ncbi:MAG: galactokinase [Nocardiopsaceae bacterium]|nr:galactokinase [Nocardiopsaceae bacterium]
MAVRPGARRPVNGVWFAPGRANLMGEHTDYNEGLVLPFALAQGVTAAVTARDDGLLVMRSKQVSGDVTVPLSDLSPAAVRGWAAYPAGVAWALRSADVPVPGATIEVDSDLPVGAGVSSSAALECAVALGLCEISGASMSRRALAAVARQAENEFVGAPTGIIDQHASLLCQAGHVMLLDCATRSITQVPFCPSAAGVAALIIDTRVTHALVSGEYGRRRAQCEEAARQLGVPFLGQVTSVSVAERLDDPVLRRRARHVVSDSLRVREIASALGGADEATGGAAWAGRPDMPNKPDISCYIYLGELLTEAHVSLRDDFEVSWPEADTAVRTAIEAGAYGARMIGGGFGGSVLALVPDGRAAAVRAAVTGTFAARHWTAPTFLDAAPSPAARRLS